MCVELNYEPILEDFYDNGELKIEAILKILENSGNHHSDAAGDQILKGSSDGKAWILTDWYVEIERFPKYGDKIKAVTWSQGATSMFSTSRDFELFCNGELCGKGTTRWIYFDLNANRPSKVTDEILAKYQPEKKSVFADAKLPKFEVPEAFSREIELTPRRNDIDFNHHVHNLVYLDYAMEALPEEVYRAHNFSTIRITYKSAVKEGEKICVKYACNGNAHTTFIYGSDGSLKTMIELGGKK